MRAYSAVGVRPMIALLEAQAAGWWSHNCAGRSCGIAMTFAISCGAQRLTPITALHRNLIVRRKIEGDVIVVGRWRRASDGQQ